MSPYLLTSWLWGARGLCPLIRAWKLNGVVKSLWASESVG